LINNPFIPCGGDVDCWNITLGTFMTLIRIGVLYPSIHNSFIANKHIEVKLTQHMMCAM
jgi:hypothetical protein